MRPMADPDRTMSARPVSRARDIARTTKNYGYSAIFHSAQGIT
ncbi:hypothetical protein OH687_06895 [Burkholderia anthina]|nr:hypothetical protein OH687_06895 [Burkholderia anthina]